MFFFFFSRPVITQYPDRVIRFPTVKQHHISTNKKFVELATQLTFLTQVTIKASAYLTRVFARSTTLTTNALSVQISMKFSTINALSKTALGV